MQQKGRSFCPTVVDNCDLTVFVQFDPLPDDQIYVSITEPVPDDNKVRYETDVRLKAVKQWVRQCLVVFWIELESTRHNRVLEELKLSVFVFV